MRATAIAGALAISPCVGPGAEAAMITDNASAIRVAQDYMKGRCSSETPCTFKARREGKQWNVWVQFTQPHAANASAKAHFGGHVVLYFDADGSLVKRMEGP